MAKYLTFEKDITYAGKTNKYGVFNLTKSLLLGFIRWHGAWRKYCFFPASNTVFDNGCMKEIIEFIDEQMLERKSVKDV